MEPERKWDVNFTKDRKIHGKSNVWSTAQWHKKIYGFDVHVGLKWNHRSVGHGKQCLLALSCVEERGWSCHKKGNRFWDWWSKDEKEAEGDMEKAIWGRKYEGWFDKERCTLLNKVESWPKSDCCWVEVNLVTFTYWGYYQIINIGVSIVPIIMSYYFAPYYYALLFCALLLCEDSQSIITIWMCCKK